MLPAHNPSPRPAFPSSQRTFYAIWTSFPRCLNKTDVSIKKAGTFCEVPAFSFYESRFSLNLPSDSFNDPLVAGWHQALHAVQMSGILSDQNALFFFFETLEDDSCCFFRRGAGYFGKVFDLSFILRFWKWVCVVATVFDNRRINPSGMNAADHQIAFLHLLSQDFSKAPDCKFTDIICALSGRGNDPKDAGNIGQPGFGLLQEMGGVDADICQMLLNGTRSQ